LIVPLAMIGLGQTPLGESVALGLILPLLLMGDCFATYQYRREWNASIVRRLLLPTVAGVVVGGALLLLLVQLGKTHAATAALLIRLEIGLESVILVGLHYWRQWRGLPPKLLPPATRAALCGGFAGLSSTMAHAAGPVVSLYLLPLQLDRREFVGTVAYYFLFLNLIKIPAFVAAGQFAATPWWLVAGLVPVVGLSALAGRFLVKRLSNTGFTAITYGLTFLVGIYLLVDSSARLIAGLVHS
jgi:uncharacterized membrane protein YfcA